jgi:hypothetical protein
LRNKPVDSPALDSNELKPDKLKVYSNCRIKDKFCAFKSGEHTHNKARMANFLMLSIRLRILMKNKTITTDPVESLFDYKTQNYPKLLSTFCLIE